MTRREQNTQALMKILEDKEENPRITDVMENSTVIESDEWDYVVMDDQVVILAKGKLIKGPKK